MKKVCISVFLSVLACSAQWATRPLRGEVRSTSPTQDLSWLVVHLIPEGAQGRSEAANVTFVGEFDFPNIPEGIYTLRLTDVQGNEVLTEPLSVGGNTAPLVIRLPQVRQERPTGQTTSVARLRHTPTKPALQAARNAQKAAQAGDYERAAVEWKNAVVADPEFSEAHGNLGVQYSRLNRPAEAEEEFRRAIALDPATGGYQSNLAIALSKMGRLDEAEIAAQRGVQQDNSNPLGHYVLGCVLTRRISSLSEAAQELRIAARTMPLAHQVLARVYEVQGNPVLAAQEMKLFQESQQESSPDTLPGEVMRNSMRAKLP